MDHRARGRAGRGGRRASGSAVLQELRVYVRADHAADTSGSLARTCAHEHHHSYAHHVLHVRARRFCMSRARSFACTVSLGVGGAHGSSDSDARPRSSCGSSGGSETISMSARVAESFNLTLDSGRARSQSEIESPWCAPGATLAQPRAQLTSMGVTLPAFTHEAPSPRESGKPTDGGVAGPHLPHRRHRARRARRDRRASTPLAVATTSAAATIAAIAENATTGADGTTGGDSDSATWPGRRQNSSILSAYHGLDQLPLAARRLCEV